LGSLGAWESGRVGAQEVAGCLHVVGAVRGGAGLNRGHPSVNPGQVAVVRVTLESLAAPKIKMWTLNKDLKILSSLPNISLYF
jgi:hypothetical protein